MSFPRNCVHSNVSAVPDPMCTYGKEIVETVKQIDSGAIIWDTKKQARPNLVEMAYHYYAEFGAEVCIQDCRISTH